MHCHRSGTLDGAGVQKVYFLWVNRDQRAFEWFTELLADLNREDTGGFFDIRAVSDRSAPASFRRWLSADAPIWMPS